MESEIPELTKKLTIFSMGTLELSNLSDFGKMVRSWDSNSSYQAQIATAQSANTKITIFSLSTKAGHEQGRP